MDKSTLLVFGAVILIGLLFIFGQPIIGSFVGDDEAPPPPADTFVTPIEEDIAPPPAPKARKIYDKITDLGKADWSKLTFQELESLIKQQQNAQLINKDEAETLDRYLNLQYLKTLNNAAEDFFRTSDNARELSGIYDELERYHSTEFAPNVRIMRTASINFYQLSRERKEVDDYVNDAEYDEAKAKQLYSKIKELSAKDYLSRSPLVAEIKKTSHAKLVKNIKDNRIEQLMPVKDYWANRPFIADTTNHFKSELQRLKSHDIVGSQKEVLTFVDREITNLEDHESLDQTLYNKAKYDERSCSAICGKFKFYVARCDSLRNQFNSVQDTIK